MKSLTILILVLSASASGIGCGSCKESAARATPATPFIIDLSSGGGFSGMHSGYVIKSDGSVVFWQGLYGRREEVRPLGSMDIDDVVRLKELIDTQKLSSVRHRETGNMTTALTVTEGELLYTITWAGADDDTTGIPEEVKPVHAALQRVLAPFREKASNLLQDGEHNGPSRMVKDK